MSKKVAIIVCAFPPQAGGMGNNAYYQAREASHLGYEVSVLTPDYRDTKKVSGDGYRIEYLPVILPIGKAGFCFSLLKRLNDFDIIHLYYPFFGSDLIVWYFKKKHPQKKLLLHYHMDPVVSGWKNFIFKNYIKIFLGLVVGASDRIAILSRDQAENSYFKKYLIKFNDKIVELPNGVDTSIFCKKEKNLELSAKLGLKNNDQVLIFVGGLDEQHRTKGLEVLLDAFKKISEKNSNLKLLVLGDGSRKQYFIDLAKNLKVGDKIIFAGWVDNEKLPDYYNLSDVFVLPSTAPESFGIVTAEAQACGLPVVVSNWPGARTTLTDNETGFLFKSGDSTDLAEKIEKILNNIELKNKFSEQAIERMKSLYDWKIVARKTDEIYKSLF
ncbi:MAG: glycosyltransferase family 4 protein [bacterium]